MGSDVQAAFPSTRTVPYFYPRPPHGERPASPSSAAIAKSISIHAPRMGSDLIAILHPLAIKIHFYPRPPHGERHLVAQRVDDIGQISIHAPRMGSDRVARHIWRRPGTFLSTPPAWGATANMAKKVPCLRLFVVQSEKTPEQFPKITRPFSEIRFPLHKIKQKLMYSAVRTSRQNNVRSRFALQP